MDIPRQRLVSLLLYVTLASVVPVLRTGRSTLLCLQSSKGTHTLPRNPHSEERLILRHLGTSLDPQRLW